MERSTKRLIPLPPAKDDPGVRMKKTRPRRLRTKIIAWSFVPTVIILSAVAWFTFFSYQKVIGDLAIKQDWAILQSRTQPLYQAFFDITNPLIVEIILQVDTQKEAPSKSELRISLTMRRA